MTSILLDESGVNWYDDRYTTPASSFISTPTGSESHEADWDEMYEFSEAMALANHYLKVPTQNLELVAKVLCRGKEYALLPWNSEEKGEVILGTPLYVSQVDRKFVDG